VEHSVEKVDFPDRQEGFENVPAAEVRKALSAVLLSVPFHSSKQSQELLQYIVDQTLAGHPEMLKERIIGASVFGRRPDYDTNDDPVVRSRAAEVRKRLALYYQTAREEPIRISIPSGSFKAVFEWANRGLAQLPAPHENGPERSHAPVESMVPSALHEVEAPGTMPASSKPRGRKWWFAIAACVAILTWVTLHYFTLPEERAFDRFWAPILDHSSPVLIYIGSNAVYELSTSYLDAYYEQHPRSQSEAMGLESYIPLPPGTKLDIQDLHPAKDTYVTIGDVAATTKIVAMLVQRNKQFDIRFGNDVAFGDLRENPTILIGAHNNSWTITMTENLRFVFDGRNGIVDRTGTQKRWSTNSDFTEDYAIVSRILNSKTGTTVITAAGIGHAGTRAAAEFLTNPQSVSALVKSLPKDWERKNIQIVLHTTVINQLPSAPDIVAFYCW
jgi:hypothetical protein